MTIKFTERIIKEKRKIVKRRDEDNKHKLDEVISSYYSMLELGDGDYWVNDDIVDINFPLKIIGDENHLSLVVIDHDTKINWKVKGGWIKSTIIKGQK